MVGGGVQGRGEYGGGKKWNSGNSITIKYVLNKTSESPSQTAEGRQRCGTSLLLGILSLVYKLERMAQI